jgi:hypothetical protein
MSTVALGTMSPYASVTVPLTSPAYAADDVAPSLAGESGAFGRAGVSVLAITDVAGDSCVHDR